MVSMKKTLEKEFKELRGFVDNLLAVKDDKIGRVRIQRHRYSDQDLFVLSNTQTEKSYLLSTTNDGKKVKSFYRMRTGEPIKESEFREMLQAACATHK